MNGSMHCCMMIIPIFPFVERIAVLSTQNSRCYCFSQNGASTRMVFLLSFWLQMLRHLNLSSWTTYCYISGPSFFSLLLPFLDDPLSCTAPLLCLHAFPLFLLWLCQPVLYLCCPVPWLCLPMSGCAYGSL